MVSSVSNSTIEIDVDGDMYIQAFEYIKVEPHTITLIRVSSKALRGNSDFFDAHIEKFGMDKPLGLHHISVTALKLWLQIFHRTLDADEVFNLSMFDFEHAIRICHQYEFKLSKMSVWFSIWLGSQYLRECDPDDLRRLLSMSNELGHNKASELLNILITEVESGLDEPAISTAFKCYPPVPIMSTRQNSILIFLLEVVPVQDYERWGFSEPFKSIYGEPLEYYSDFYRLMTTTFDQRVVPQLKSFASLGADELSGRFLWFCQMSDDIARTRSLPMLKRREMEAAWVWIAFDFYEKDSTIDPVALKKVITQRVHPRVKVEAYWTDKCAKLGWAPHEIAFLEDGCEEDPDTEKIVDGDEDLDMDPVADDVAGEQTSTQLEGLVKDLSIQNKKDLILDENGLESMSEL